MNRISFHLPNVVRGMLPSIAAFGILTTCMAGYVSLDRSADQDTAVTRINLAMQACPEIRTAAEAIAEKRTPTTVDAARIVAMGRRAAGRISGCRGLVREPAPEGALTEEGYWLADRVMQIGDECPLVRTSANAVLDDGRVEMREAGNLMVSARQACPKLDLRKFN